MGAVSAFHTGNYHCKPLMTDVIVIPKQMEKKESKKVALLPLSRTHQACAQIWGHPFSTSKGSHLILTAVHSKII